MDNSKILTFFNMKLDTFIIAVSIMTVILIITLFFLLLDYLKIRKRYMEFMTGETGKNLEYTIYKRFRDIDQLKVGQKDNDDQIEIIYDMVRRSYNKIGIYHYNAFSPSKSFNGGSISFAMAMLNSSDNGFVLNVIHNRAGCHVYLKEIVDASSEMTLAEEEMIAIERAINYKKEDIPESFGQEVQKQERKDEPFVESKVIVESKKERAEKKQSDEEEKKSDVKADEDDGIKESEDDDITLDK